MIVLGIDPGTAMTGYGLVERTGSRLRAVDYGCLETPAGMPLPERLLLIQDGLIELVETHRPDLVAVERLFFNKNVQTAFAVGQARGVALLDRGAVRACRSTSTARTRSSWLSPATAGREKVQVQRMVQVVLGLAALPRPDDAADALAIAICLAHAHRPAA